MSVKWLVVIGSGLALLGAASGMGLGRSSASGPETVIETQRETVTRTRTVTKVKRRIVRRTITQVVTNEVLRGDTNAVNLGGFEGTIDVRGVQGYTASDDEAAYTGGEIVGQVMAPSGCAGYVELSATFYSDGTITDTNIGNFSSLPAGVWRTFEISADPVDWDTYDVVVSQADC